MPYLFRLLLALCAASGPCTAASWVFNRSIGEGAANRVVRDGSRLCAATADGVYCREREQEAWQPVFFHGKYVETLARTRSGWVVFLYEPDALAPFTESMKPYVSRDGGVRWSPGRLPWSRGQTGPQALGDSLIRHADDTVELSRDGGETWEALPPPPGPIRECALSSGYILCATNDRIIGYSGSGEWSALSANGIIDGPSAFGGRICFLDSHRALSVYGKGGLERRLPPLDGYSLILASDSLLLAYSRSGFAFAQAGDTGWTFSPAPYQINQPYFFGGVWKDGEAFLQGSDSPRKVRVEGGKLVIEPYGQGIPSKQVIRLHPDGGSLYVQTLNAIWQAGPDGRWKNAFQREALISGFFCFGGKAMVGSRVINGGNEDAAPPLFTEDSGRTWQRQPSSLPGFVYAMARLGKRYLALTMIQPGGIPDPSASSYYSLYEAEAWMGPWSARADRLPFPFWGDLSVSGSRLYSNSGSEAMVSEDSGKSWAPTGFPRIVGDCGDRVYAADTAGAVWECGSSAARWTRVFPPEGDPGMPALVNRTAGEPLLAVYARDSALSRVYPLPGASPAWAGVEAFAVPGFITSMASREGILYAAIRDQGLYVLDMRTNGIRSRPSARRSGIPRGPTGWRRVDGRAIATGSPVPRTPLFRSQSFRPVP